MKKLSKILSLLLCVAILAAACILGTLAYLTSRSSVTNTFTVGNVSITLDEEKVTPDGEPTPEDDNRVQENNYHLVPGESYLKDPTVTVKAKSEPCYVRTLVTIRNASVVNEITGDKPLDLLTGWDSTNWTILGNPTVDTTANTVTYEVRYNTIVDASEVTDDVKLSPVFTTLTVPGTTTGEQLQALYSGSFKVIVDGHAIQSATFADADAAWAAFDAQMNP